MGERGKMKVWRRFGSAHSARLTVIGQFKNVDDAQVAEQVVEDFVNACWEERYPGVKEFISAWKTRLPGIEALGPNQSDFNMGIDNACNVTRSGSIVSVSDIRSTEIGGIIKLMLLKDSEEVKIEGKTGP